MQELQTEIVAKVPGGTHDTKECNTPTNSVSMNVSVKTCQAFCGRNHYSIRNENSCYSAIKLFIYVFHAVVLYEIFYMMCEKWKNARYLIRTHSDFEQTLRCRISPKRPPCPGVRKHESA